MHYVISRNGINLQGNVKLISSHLFTCMEVSCISLTLNNVVVEGGVSFSPKIATILQSSP